MLTIVETADCSSYNWQLVRFTFVKFSLRRELPIQMSKSRKSSVQLSVPPGLTSNEANPSEQDSISRSITEEQLWRQATLLDLSFDAIFAWKIDGGISYWNRGAQSLFGFSAEEALEIAPQELLKTVLPGPLPAIIDTIVREGHWEGRLIQTSKHGRQITVVSRQHLVNQANGKFVLEINRDLTELVSGERVLAAVRAADEAARQASIDFLAHAGHEIRSPLAAILGFTELLVPHDESDMEKISTIRRNGELLAELINDVMEYVIIEAGRFELHFEPFSPTRLLEEICTSLKNQASKQSIHLSWKIDKNVPEEIVSDPPRLRKILVNLLANAIKFTDSGSIVVSAKMVSETNQICFEVTDTGTGINPEQLPRIFKPFEQVDSGIPQRFGGSGLGLAISQGLAHALGGKITVQSIVGRGSTFSCFIACEVSKRGDIDIATDSTVEPLTEHYAAKSGGDHMINEPLKLRVLVVDDRRDIRRIASHVIEGSGASVIFAENGRQAVEIMSQEENRGSIDLILMDVQMPELDGLEATRQLRSKGFALPIIALTGNTMDQDRVECLRAGYTDFLPKPICAADLLKMLKAHQRANPSCDNALPPSAAVGQ
jgi:PAS domain S-box-containing protein